MKNKKDFVFVVLSIIVAFASVVLLITGGLPELKKGETSAPSPVSENSIKPYGFETSDIITESVNADLSPSDISVYSKTYETVLGILYMLNNASYRTTDKGFWADLGPDEWVLYSFLADTDLYTYVSQIKDITGQKSLLIETEVEQSGYIGAAFGGFSAGCFLDGDGTQYYIESFVADCMGCAYLTTNKDKVFSGYDLIKKNIMTMIPDPAVLEGSGDDDDEVIKDQALKVDELVNGAKYNNFSQPRDYKKMRLLFTTTHFEKINKLYLRRVETDEIIYPADDEPHADTECQFIVDNVHAGEQFQMVVFSDDDPGEVDMRALEYDDSSYRPDDSAVSDETPDEPEVSDDGDFIEIMEVSE